MSGSSGTPAPPSHSEGLSTPRQSSSQVGFVIIVHSWGAGGVWGLCSGDRGPEGEVVKVPRGTGLSVGGTEQVART